MSEKPAPKNIDMRTAVPGSRIKAADEQSLKKEMLALQDEGDRTVDSIIADYAPESPLPELDPYYTPIPDEGEVVPNTKKEHRRWSRKKLREQRKAMTSEQKKEARQRMSKKERSERQGNRKNIGNTLKNNMKSFNKDVRDIWGKNGEVTQDRKEWLNKSKENRKKDRLARRAGWKKYEADAKSVRDENTSLIDMVDRKRAEEGERGIMNKEERRQKKEEARKSIPTAETNYEGTNRWIVNRLRPDGVTKDDLDSNTTERVNALQNRRASLVQAAYDVLNNRAEFDYEEGTITLRQGGVVLDSRGNEIKRKDGTPARIEGAEPTKGMEAFYQKEIKENETVLYKRELTEDEKEILKFLVNEMDERYVVREEYHWKEPSIDAEGETVDRTDTKDKWKYHMAHMKFDQKLGNMTREMLGIETAQESEYEWVDVEWKGSEMASEEYRAALNVMATAFANITGAGKEDPIYYLKAMAEGRKIKDLAPGTPEYDADQKAKQIFDYMLSNIKGLLDREGEINKAVKLLEEGGSEEQLDPDTAFIAGVMLDEGFNLKEFAVSMVMYSLSGEMPAEILEDLGKKDETETISETPSDSTGFILEVLGEMNGNKDYVKYITALMKGEEFKQPEQNTTQEEELLRAIDDSAELESVVDGMLANTAVIEAANKVFESENPDEALGKLPNDMGQFTMEVYNMMKARKVDASTAFKRVIQGKLAELFRGEINIEELKKYESSEAREVKEAPKEITPKEIEATEKLSAEIVSRLEAVDMTGGTPERQLATQYLIDRFKNGVKIETPDDDAKLRAYIIATDTFDGLASLGDIFLNEEKIKTLAANPSSTPNLTPAARRFAYQVAELMKNEGLDADTAFAKSAGNLTEEIINDNLVEKTKA